MSYLDVPGGLALIILGFVVGAIVHRHNVIRDRAPLNTWADASARARRNARGDGAK